MGDNYYLVYLYDNGKVLVSNATGQGEHEEYYCNYGKLDQGGFRGWIVACMGTNAPDAETAKRRLKERYRQDG